VPSPYLWGMRLVYTFLLAAAATAQLAVDPRLPDYVAKERVTGRLCSIGSDSMNNQMMLWQAAFRKLHPELVIEIRGKGSSTAIPPLLTGRSEMGPMTRPLREDEAKAYQARFGSEPVQLTTSLQVLAVFVHVDNPLEALSLAQVDAIFSSTRHLGHPKPLNLWGDLGLRGKWEAAVIAVNGRNSAANSYGMFKRLALGKGDFRSTIKEQPSAPVVWHVGKDPFAIGYSDLGYETDAVRVLSLNGKAPTAAHIYSGDYPLARGLMLTIGEMKPAVREFLRFVYSRQGQEIAVKDGLYPVSFEVAAEQAAKVGISLKKRS
jgi:phosphate transport system substrate-binding protein